MHRGMVLVGLNDSFIDFVVLQTWAVQASHLVFADFEIKINTYY